MTGLKRPLTGLLIFSLLSGASLAVNREALIFREVLGLYTTGQYPYALALLDRFEKNSKITLPQLMLVSGYVYEASGRFAEAERFLNLSWGALKGMDMVRAAVEDAAIRAFALENGVGGSVVVDLALRGSSGESRCYLLFNSWLIKRELGLEEALEGEEFLSDCRGVWFYPLMAGYRLHRPSQTPRR